MFSFLLAASILLFAVNVSAAPLATVNDVEVDGVSVFSDPALIVGDKIMVKVEFVSLANVSDVTVEAELEGDKADASSETASFDVESGRTYAKSLVLEVPFDLKDELSGDVTLTVTIKGDNGFVTEEVFTLRVQRESYDANIKSVSVPQPVKAGELFPVDIVLKNLGYNNLDDLYVTVSIPALNVERTSFFGDVVALECDEDSTAVENYGVDVSRKCNEDNEDTVLGRVFVQLPWNVKSGAYALEVTAESDDTTSSKTIQIDVLNAFSSGNFIVSGNKLLIVNPTNDVAVYRLVPEASNGVSVSLSDSVVAVPAGSSKTVTVSASSNANGVQTYAVNVFSADGALLDKVTFATGSESRATSPIVVLTVILAIIFIVLLVVLIVLVGKKPEKEEFGESYY